MNVECKQEFNVILADPPWQSTAGIPSRLAENHYPTMSTEDICKLPIPAAKDCVLFLWATAPKLPDALKVMEAWGFEYKTHAIWDKMIIGMGYYFRGQHELLLIGKKGNPRVPIPENRFSSIIKEKRTEHSKKPIIVYSMIEKMYPNGKYFEMFAREHWNGWDVMGSESPLDKQLKFK